MPAKIDKKRAAALQAYYDTLAGFAQQYALHEVLRKGVLRKGDITEFHSPKQ